MFVADGVAVGVGGQRDRAEHLAGPLVEDGDVRRFVRVRAQEGRLARDKQERLGDQRPAAANAAAELAEVFQIEILEQRVIDRL